jgi:L-iditol 2-dehydrogenase
VCETLHTTNFYPGGFAEYIRVPGINVERGTFLLPEEISFEEATFIEPLACVVRAQRMADLQPAQHILIIGGGTSGLLHLLLAQVRGASRIIVADINEYRLKIAQEFGADLAINAKKEDIAARLRQGKEGRLVDLIIICTTAREAFLQALQCVDRAGTILCFAPTEAGVTLPLPVNDFWRNSIKIMHSYGNVPLDAAIAIELIGKVRVSVGNIITHRLSLKEAQLGFRLVSQGKDSIKVIIKPHR